MKSFLKSNYNLYIKEKHKKTKKIDDIYLSIIIVSYNTNMDLLLCIKSITEQLIPKAEIIVIDNGYNDLVYNRLLEYPINYIKLKNNMGVCFGRNVGITESKGEILAFLDDDCLVDNNFINNALSIFKNRSIYGLRGKIKFKTKTIYNLLQNHYDLGNSIFPYFINVEGVCIVRKQALIEVGGWNENIWGHEGAELSYRLVNKFGRDGLIYHPDIIIYHDFANSLRKLIKKDIRHQKVYQLLKKDHNYIFNFTNSYKLESKVSKVSTEYKLSFIDRFKIYCIEKIRYLVLTKPKLQKFLELYL